MALSQLLAPTVEPIDLDEAKRQLRIDGEHEDLFISGLIVTSRLQLEASLGLAMIDQIWRLRVPASCAQEIELPLYPVREIVMATAVASDGSGEPINPSHLVLVADRRPQVVKLQSIPASAREVHLDLKAGYGADGSSVPGPLKQALGLLVAHWFENREPSLPGAALSPLPLALDTLLQPYRRVRL